MNGQTEMSAEELTALKEMLIPDSSRNAPLNPPRRASSSTMRLAVDYRDLNSKIKPLVRETLDDRDEVLHIRIRAGDEHMTAFQTFPVRSNAFWVGNGTIGVFSVLSVRNTTWRE